MSYLSNGIQDRLQRVFAENNMSLRVRSDHILVEGSRGCTREKIQQIIASAQFLPLISENRISGNFVFTIFPYKAPHFFKQTAVVLEKLSLNQKPLEKNQDLYLSKDEIFELLNLQKFVATEGEVKDRWSDINCFRNLVTPALNKVLSETIEQHSQPDHPIMEIGSGIGYPLSEEVSLRTIRMQPNQQECQLLSQAGSGPIYKMDIERMYSCLSKSGKKVSLFFALNVFDTLPPELRKTSFYQLSQLQSSGDRILIMLDTNPELRNTHEQLESLYPGHGISPYFSSENDIVKISALAIPIGCLSHKPLPTECYGIVKHENSSVKVGEISKAQQKLNTLQKELNLPVIDTENFFAERVKDELMQVGYEVGIYYQNAFVHEKPPKELFKVKQDLFYKSVADRATVRQWRLTDEKLLDSLSQRGLGLPSHFNEEFLISLRERGELMFGAEILVISAKKI